MENKFKLDEAPLDMSKWTEKIIREVNETEDAFIFTSVKPFLDSISTFEIRKEELVRAVLLIRMQREAIEKYGVILPNDFHSATELQTYLESAYRKGYEAGRREGHNLIDEFYKEFKKATEKEEEDKEND